VYVKEVRFLNTKRWIALSLFIVLFIFSTVGKFNQMGSTASFDLEREWSEHTYKQGGLQRLALLKVDGVIMDQPSGDIFSPNSYNHRLFLKQLEHAFKDESIKGIVLRINSPGGGVVESDEIFYKIMQLKEEYKKPIVTYMSNMAASGGYYIAAPTNEIFANRSTITGSIGVIMQNFNVQELAEEWGIKTQTFKSGPHKDIMSPFKEMTEEERKILQALTDEMYKNFVNVIVEGRGMDRQKVLKLADGRIYSGQQAKEVGLVDHIGFLDDALNRVAELAGVDNPTVIEYKVSSWAAFDSVFNVLKSSSPDALGIREVLLRQGTPSLMYLYSW
jgi:protease-4